MHGLLPIAQARVAAAATGDASLLGVGRSPSILLGQSAGALEWVLGGAIVALALGLLLQQAIVRAQRKRQPPAEQWFSRHRLSQLVANARLPMALVHVKGDILRLNHSFIATFGYAAEELRTLPDWLERAYPQPENRERVSREWCGRLLSATAVFDDAPYETRVTCRDGRVLTVEWSATRLDDVTLVLGMDLTTRLQHQQALELSEERYRLLLEHAPEAVVVIDVAQNRFVDCNAAAERLLQYPREQLLCLGPLDVTPPTQPDGTSSRDFLAQQIARVQSGDTPVVEWVHRNRAGKDFPCEVRLLRLPDPTGRHLVRGSVVDIGARKLAEDRLREREERFRLLIENSTELVAQVDQAGTFVYVSPNHQAITGYTSEELIGRGVFEFIHSDDVPQVLEAFSSTTHQAVRVFRYRFKDGTWHWLESAGRRFHTSGGIEMAAVISRDITQRVQAEEGRNRLEVQLQQSQKMEAIGTLAGGIAHDFNNILTGLFGNLQLAQRQLPPGHPTQPLLEASFQACTRARDLVASILTFSRRQEQQKDVHALQPIVSEAVGLLRASLPATIQIRTSDAANHLHVRCDPGQIHQVIMNLGANAAHAMRTRGGVLTITIATATPSEDVVTAFHPHAPPARLALLTIRDTGSGMDATTRERIFEPFFTTKPVGEGTGLGLAVVHGIIEGHGGAVHVDSTPGVGTCFRIWLPLADEVPASGPAAAESRERSTERGHGERILFVDDETAVCQIGTRILQTFGYHVTNFTRPTDALAHFRTHPDEFDLLVTDLTMPELTGPELAVEVRRLRPGLPVLMTTGLLRPADLDQARAAGIQHFLEKPFAAEVLADSVRRALTPP